ncbi:unnamed protein product [Anisakis simplex]|uniref:Uncharacterized protein n=1 Tax=Anisakis simplex TaxID=6269 RepID=A0A3P6Q5B2_ANISI|nr:unnamed protein product [Anisakis simplex]
MALMVTVDDHSYPVHERRHARSSRAVLMPNLQLVLLTNNDFRLRDRVEPQFE